VESIVAATDLTDSDLPSLRYARLLARRFSAKLTVIYSEPVVYPVNFIGPAEAFFVDATPEHIAELRSVVDKHVRPPLGDGPFEIHVTIGPPVPAILLGANEVEADLIVMGTHGRRGWRRAFFGSVSDGVIHGSRCPVLVVGRETPAVAAAPVEVTKVLCPVNFTEASRDALLVAARMTNAFAAHLTVAHVVEQSEVSDRAADEEKVRQWVGSDVQGISSWRELVLRGGAAERVLDCADDIGADLIVVGAQHRRFRDVTVIGTTTERIIRFASAPVLIVPREAITREQTPDQEAELAAAERSS
jgi:nucleotide-binding universal stress UspA family protein